MSPNMRPLLVRSREPCASTLARVEVVAEAGRRGVSVAALGGLGRGRRGRA